MSLTLSESGDICVKTDGINLDKVFFGDHTISLRDYLEAAFYILTNDDLWPEGDPRLQFVKCVKSMNVVPGHNIENDPEVKRLASDIPPSLSREEYQKNLAIAKEKLKKELNKAFERTEKE